MAGISAGQILFKLAARSVSVGAPANLLAKQLALNPFLLTGLVLYGATTVVWVLILRVVPLGLAYSYMALAFLFVPILAASFLGEPLSVRILAGGALIVAGICVVS